jgi:hypothetical protein
MELMRVTARKHGLWLVCFARALEMVSANPKWLAGEIAYAETHAFAVVLKKWVWALVAPIPDKSMCVVEAVDLKGGEDFKVILTPYNGAPIDISESNN